MATKKSSRRRTRRTRTTRGSARAQPRAAATTSRAAATRSRAAAQPMAIETTAERLAEIDAGIEVLRGVVARLKAMTTAEVAALSLADRQARAHTLSNANLAIEDLENAKLVALNQAFESRRPELVQATSRLAGDLARLQDIVAFIGAAAAAVGIVADIAAVIR